MSDIVAVQTFKACDLLFEYVKLLGVQLLCQRLSQSGCGHSCNCDLLGKRDFRPVVLTDKDLWSNNILAGLPVVLHLSAVYAGLVAA